MDSTESRAKLSLKIRILIGIAGLPSIFLAYMLIVTALNDGVSGISLFEVIYSLVGFLALYIAVTGKRLF